MTTTAPEELTLSIEREEDTLALGARLARLLRPRDLLVLTGQLGAGKTFLAGAIVHALGHPEEDAVPSPTYSLLIEYPTAPPVAHADLYRLGDPSEVELLAPEDLRRRGYILLVEWGEEYLAELGEDGVHVFLAADPRRARLVALGPRGAELLAGLDKPDT